MGQKGGALERGQWVEHFVESFGWVNSVEKMRKKVQQWGLGVAYMCEWGGAQGWISGVERAQGTAVTSTRDISNCFVYLPWQQLVI